MSSPDSEHRPQTGEIAGSSQIGASSPVAVNLDPPTIIKPRAETPSSFARQFSAPLLPQPGDRIDSFELERAIGIGGMGAVFLAIDSRLQREVALKILPPEQSNDSEVVQRFYQEGRAAARLDHENIARVFTIGSDKGYHFIAFEYIEGLTLRQRVAEIGHLGVSEAINYTLQIAGALVHAAERGVVHRDIKPSNIIITPQGRVKLVDMGLARHFERGYDDRGLTQSGMTLGTFDYISPEQARDPRDVDVRGDLYSLGCTLFHMLTGRPPFPEGTVLQKLLQHQEEPPPDVRLQNPDVPQELSIILTKLMAKDRERRYQTPEFLVRDLLTLAGALGLRSLSPEGLVWMSSRIPPPWEKHLVWGIPVAALASVVGVLIWWGQPAETATRQPESSGMPVVVAPKPPVDPPKIVKESPRPEVVKEVPKETIPPPRARPREVSIKSGENLTAAIAREASGSTFTLADDGPFLLTPSAVASKNRRDVTIKAASGTHPVVKSTRGSTGAAATSEPCLLAFGPGSVTIEGVDFALDPGEDDASWTAIRADGTDLSLKSCSFRRIGLRSGLSRQTAIQFRPSGPDSSSLRADSSYFDGGIMAVWSRAASAIQMRDCTFGPQDPSFLFDNVAAEPLVPVELVLKHASFQVGRGPVVRSLKTELKAVVEDCVIATLRDRNATLVETDDPDRLSWRGKGNLYSGIDTFLRPTRGLLGRGVIASFDAWADDPRAYREALSMPKDPPIWEGTDSSIATDRVNPAAAFVVGSLERPSSQVGARRGPRGRIISLEEGLADLAGIELPAQVAETVKKTATTKAAEPIVRAAPATESPKIMASPPDVVAASPMPMPMPMPMPVEREAQPMPATPVDRTSNVTVAEAPKAEPAEKAHIENPPGENIVVEPATVKTQAAFLAALEKLGPRGGTVKLAFDADFSLPAIEVKGPGRVIVQAENGTSRPLVKFRPNAREAAAGGRRVSLFTVKSGSLELQGIDLVLESVFAPERGDWSVFRASPGVEVSLVRSTVTVEGRVSKSAVFLVPSPEEDGENVEANTALAQFRASESLIRTGGDILDIAAGRRLDAELSNTAIAAGGSLVHGHGLARGQVTEALRLVLRQVTARLEGGLAFLESSPGEPELPIVDLSARDILVTTDEDRAPLFRIDGQESFDGLKNSIKWDGNNVHYHKIEVYRRDQTTRPGTLPQRFDRASWDLAVAPRDMSPFHGDAQFLKKWTADRPLAEIARDDFALDPDGPAVSVGPEIRRLPQAPPIRNPSVAPK